MILPNNEPVSCKLKYLRNVNVHQLTVVVQHLDGLQCTETYLWNVKKISLFFKTLNLITFRLTHIVFSRKLMRFVQHTMENPIQLTELV